MNDNTILPEENDLTEDDFEATYRVLELLRQRRDEEGGMGEYHLLNEAHSRVQDYEQQLGITVRTPSEED